MPMKPARRKPWSWYNHLGQAMLWVPFLAAIVYQLIPMWKPVMMFAAACLYVVVAFHLLWRE